RRLRDRRVPVGAVPCPLVPDPDSDPVRHLLSRIRRSEHPPVLLSRPGTAPAAGAAAAASSDPGELVLPASAPGPATRRPTRPGKAVMALGWIFVRRPLWVPTILSQPLTWCLALDEGRSG